MRSILSILCLCALATSLFADEPKDPRPLDQQPYAGLRFRDDPASDFLKVGWVLPGPLEGTTFRSKKLSRGDLILSVNGKQLTAEQFENLIDRSKPGDELTLVVRPSPRRGEDRPQPEHTVSLVLARRSDWSGPISFARGEDRPIDLDAVLPGYQPSKLEAYLDEQIRAHDLRGEFEKVRDLLAKQQPLDVGYNSLSRVAHMFHRPMRTPSLQAAITKPLPALTHKPTSLFAVLAENLDAKRPTPADRLDLTSPVEALEVASAAHAAAEAHMQRALAGIDAETKTVLRAGLDELLQGVIDIGYVSAHDDPAKMMRVMRASMGLDYDAMLAAGAALGGFVPKQTLPDEVTTAAHIETPAELSGACKGKILAAKRTDRGWLVFGGSGENEYDMAKLAVVIDAGGDDVYRYGETSVGSIQVVVDFAGDDLHEAADGGPGGAILGISLLVDHAGDDVYRAKRRGCGAGVMGLGLLIDHAGNDEYYSSYWSQGAGVYGAGVILDLHGGDIYKADQLCQAVGGPKGVGLILDAGGSDLYHAYGPTPSAYGTAAVFFSACQGVGYGFRMYETGGLGILSDLGGNDRYIAGEFSQGGGYYHGLGVLHDRGGDDLYVGQRYAQGWGCHSAHGVLADEQGNDTYFAAHVGAQGMAWDLGVGFLIDQAGSDSYQFIALGQGGAANQSFACLIDLEGTDRYVCGGECHGMSGQNSYHFHETGVRSVSVMLDAGGTEDYYSTGRPNGATTKPAKINEEKPAYSNLYGVFIDLPVKKSLR